METAGKGALDVDAANASLPTPAPPPTNVTPAPLRDALRAKLEAVHRAYQARFDRDEKASVTAFQQKRAEFQAQLNSVRSSNGRQQQAAFETYEQLNTARMQVHDTMVKDTQRVIHQVAAEHHISVVITDPLAAGANVVDLTPEVIGHVSGEAR
jgi:Skp family chaperone for outer membrane proteins